MHVPFSKTRPTLTATNRWGGGPTGSDRSAKRPVTTMRRSTPSPGSTSRSASRSPSPRCGPSAPRPVQEQILDTHHEAVEATLAWMEEQVINTRSGRNGVAHVGTRGIIAAAFDHWESRTGDPQLHTHLVIANRVQRVTDGAWATLDSRTLYKAVVAASEHYNGLLFDALRTSIGTETDIRAPPAQNTHNPSQQLSGIAEALIREFSNRSRLIDIETDRLVEQWTTEHRTPPTATTTVRLRQQATLSTRTPKDASPAPLRLLSAQWRARAMAQGFDPESVVASTIRRSRSRPLQRW